MPVKIIGYLLLTAGLLTILLSGLNIYQVFTQQADPITALELSGVSLDLSQLVPSYPGFTNTSTSKTDLIPSNTLNDISNLTAHYFLVSFIASLGFKVSSLGNQLLRPVEVKLQANSQKSA